MELLLATHNLHKLREFKAMLKNETSLDLLSLIDFPHYVPPEETGSSFEENAILKATHAATTLQKWTLADDSGLVVPALNGTPGIYSARYAGENKSDKENRQKLIQELKKLPPETRSAYFTCTLALANPEKLLKCVHGSCEGTLLTEERGGQGFGYDPLFIKQDYRNTFAQLDEETKIRISHRRNALDKMLSTLRTHQAS